MTRVLTTCVVAPTRKLLMSEAMKNRSRTLTVKMSDAELAKVHAIAAAGDESIGRYLRRVVASDYERRFGDAPPPTPTLRRGRNQNADAAK